MQGNVNRHAQYHWKGYEPGYIPKANKERFAEFWQHTDLQNASKQHFANYRHETSVLALSLAEDRAYMNWNCLEVQKSRFEIILMLGFVTILNNKIKLKIYNLELALILFH